jgi:hypothetical protein
LRVLKACRASSFGAVRRLDLVAVHCRTWSSVSSSTASHRSFCAGSRKVECTSEQLLSVSMSMLPSLGARWAQMDERSSSGRSWMPTGGRRDVEHMLCG